VRVSVIAETRHLAIVAFACDLGGFTWEDDREKSFHRRDSHGMLRHRISRHRARAGDD
jgi:hypothetical protein